MWWKGRHISKYEDVAQYTLYRLGLKYNLLQIWRLMHYCENNSVLRPLVIRRTRPIISLFRSIQNTVRRLWFLRNVLAVWQTFVKIVILLLVYMPLPPTERDGRQYVLGYAVRPSERPLSVNICFAWRDISVRSGGILTKLITDIRHGSGHCWKAFQGQRLMSNRITIQ